MAQTIDKQAVRVWALRQIGRPCYGTAAELIRKLDDGEFDLEGDE